MEANPGMSQERLVDRVSEIDHAIGPADAPITLVEYGDYECPSCLNALPIVRAVREQLGDRLRFVFRHFPLSSVHPHASMAAEAAEAAEDQGKFWAMHEALFKHQQQLDRIDYSHLALTLGLEIYKFEASRAKAVHRERVKVDYAGGKRSGVKRTPTFFINGVKYTGRDDVDAILTCIGAMPQA